jgi:hypothetical protein
MRDIVRIFRKDLQRFWPFAIAAALLAFFLAFFPMLGLNHANYSVISAAESLRFIVVGLVVVAVVQEDLVMSDRAAWITRPVKAPTMLAAKLLFFLALLAFPFGIITAVGAHQFDLGVGVCAAIGGEEAARLFLVTVLFSLIGAITSSLLTAVVFFACSAAVLLVLQPYLALIAPEGRAIDSLDSSRPVTLVAIAILVVGVLGYHYGRRQLRRTALVAAIALVLGVVFANWSGTVPRQIGEAPRVGIKAKQSRGFVGAVLGRPFPMSDQVVIGLETVISYPSDADYRLFPDNVSFISPDGRKISQRIPTGASIPTDARFSSQIVTSWDNYPEIARSALRISLKGRDPDSMIPILVLPSRIFAELRGTRGSLALHLSASKNYLAARGILALEPGATVSAHGCRMRIESVQFVSGSGLEISVRETRVESPFVSRFFQVALINDQADEVSLGEYNHDWADFALSYLIQDSRESYVFAHRWKRQSDKVDAGISSEWLKSAHLAYYVIGWSPPRSGTVDLVVPDFSMPTVGGIQ